MAQGDAADPLASPCVRNCCLDDGNVCLGCGRSLAEIVRWSNAPDDEKREILERAKQRAAARREPTLR
jgi:predicted Fe-S protein YdhL (DUF1289 family)